MLKFTLIIIAVTVTAITTKKWSHHRPAIESANNTITLQRQLDQETTMICANGSDLKFCMFTEPDSEKTINIDTETMKLFSTPLQPINIHPNNKSCGILVPKTKLEHEGTWRCQVYMAAGARKGTGTTWHGKPMARINKFFKLEIIHNQTQVMQNTTVQIPRNNHHTISIVTITMIMTIIAAFTLVVKGPKAKIPSYRTL